MEIRPIKKSEWEKLRAFNAEMYSPTHVLTNPDYYNWQFDSPFNKDKSAYSSLGLFKRDELVGTIGAFSVPCSISGKPVNCNWMANLIVRPELRALGYGYLLMKEAAKGFDLVVDHNINTQTWPMFIKAGYKGGDINRYVCVLNQENVRRLIGKEGIVLSATKSENSSPDIRELKRFDEDFSELWKRVKERYGVTIDRGNAYMNWRYADCKVVNYRILATYSGSDMVALAVLRVDEITEGPDKHPANIRIGRIIDFISDEKSEDRMTAGIVRFCREANIDLIDFFSTGQFGIPAFEQNGFVNSDQEPHSLIPTLLNPIDRVKRTRHNFAYFINSQNIDGAMLSDLNNWYTTKGCGDQDRPY